MEKFINYLKDRGTLFHETEEGIIVYGSVFFKEDHDAIDLPENLHVCGNLYLQAYVKELPKGLVVAGDTWIDSRFLEKIPEDVVFGGSLTVYDVKTGVMPNNLSIGGYLSLQGHKIKTLPEGLVVGTWISIDSGFIKDIPESWTFSSNVYFGNTLYSKVLPTGESILVSWQNGRYITVDGIFTEVVQHRGNVWKVKKLDHSRIFYLITDGEGRYAHGDTLDEARESLVFKLSKRSVEDYKKLTLESVLTFPEAVSCYRTITGACEFGVRQFVEQNNLKKQDYTVQQMLELTTDAYGGSTFSKFFK